MAVPGGDDIREPVAVHVIHQHLGGGVGEMKRMKRPRLVRLRMRRLFPPTDLFEDVRAAIAVEVAEPDAVRVALIAFVRPGDGVENPRSRGMRGIRSGVAEPALVVEEEFRTTVAGYIAPYRGFIAHHVVEQMPRPMAGLSPRIFEPVALLARPGHAEDVRPSVAVEIAGVGQKVVRIVFRIKGLDRTVFVPFDKVRAFKPKRPGHDVQFAVTIEVAVIRALGVKLISKPQFFIVVARRQRRWFGGRRCGRGGCGGHRSGRRRQGLQSGDRSAVSADQSRPGRPSAAALGDFEPQRVGALAQANRNHVLIGHVAPVHIVAVNHLIIEPSFHAVVAANQEQGIGGLWHNHPGLQKSRAIFRTRKKQPQVDMFRARHGLPCHGLVGHFRAQSDIKDRQRPRYTRLMKRSANLPVLNERSPETQLFGNRQARGLRFRSDRRIRRCQRREFQRRRVRHPAQPGQHAAFISGASRQCIGGHQRVGALFSRERSRVIGNQADNALEGGRSQIGIGGFAGHRQQIRQQIWIPRVTQGPRCRRAERGRVILKSRAQSRAERFTGEERAHLKQGLARSEVPLRYPPHDGGRIQALAGGQPFAQ
ncbi:MAG: hypothetical protein BWX84_02005 [Verrucomicrobia bacterium ADurb.Bin118]|nr:MAG: hypothetical protein BWX84_02005 [Verrucomicrobia bacterium ADurb.Bin118]